ncbi:Inner membrane protein ALBINO3 [Citrus sinensis]|uniref:Inner membrane protein ALBINO3 n=1 Tax=Citrus sinensis TaxID=2711 RepID=A0ACB8IVE2_CITSI|nr:Inner membrane protein ALBINO3 [Citrus sinensis]
MTKTLISSPPFVGTPLPSPSSSLSRHGLHRLPNRRLASTRVRLSFQEIPPILSLDSSIDLNSVFSRTESLLYTLADAAVSLDSASGGAASTSADGATQKNGGWFGFISEAMEFVLKILKDGIDAVHVPYSYGFAIILLTVIVKVATFPLTKKQVESTLAMQNLQPKIKAIQQRYAGNQERIQLETSRLYRQAGVNPLAEGFFWIPSLSGPTTIAARQSGSGISWLLPFVTDDPAQKNTLLVFKFLPLMIGYFSLSVPSGLSIYWFTNNVLSTAQQVWLRKLGGAKPVVTENASEIITAGRAKRSVSQPSRAGDRFRQLKEEEKGKKLNKALPAEDVQTMNSASDSEGESDGEKGQGVLEEAYASNRSKQVPDPSRPRKSKRSKRKRAV